MHVENKMLHDRPTYALYNVYCILYNVYMCNVYNTCCVYAVHFIYIHKSSPILFGMCLGSKLKVYSSLFSICFGIMSLYTQCLLD